MSNLLKSSNIIINSDNKLVIDSNKMAEALLAQSGRKNYGVQAQEADADGFVCGLDAATVEQLVADEPVDNTAVLAEANEQAEQIIAQAQADAEQMYAEARQSGYDEGINQAMADAQAQINAKIEELQKEYADKNAALEAEYQELRNEMEKELASTILDVVANVTGAIAEDKKDIVMHLINGVMRNAELSKEFIIKVSEEDYKFVVNNKEMIYGATSPDYHIEVIMDPSFERNQCVIETDAGVFDCSLDIQLQNLIQEIRILSCMH